jgi:hypothetical protein
MDMIQTQMREVLAETIRILFPLTENPLKYIKRHIWRTKSVLGAVDDVTIYWQGWSAGLRDLSPDYRTIYVDYVENLLPKAETIRLFGKDFAEEICSMSAFVVFFTAGFHQDQYDTIKQIGFIPRTVGRNYHASYVMKPDDFVQQPHELWASKTTKLAQLKYTTLSEKLNTGNINLDNSVDSFDDLDLLDF